MRGGGSAPLLPRCTQLSPRLFKLLKSLPFMLVTVVISVPLGAMCISFVGSCYVLLCVQLVPYDAVLVP